NVLLIRLKKSGFAIVATIVDPQAEKVWAVDFAGKIALVVGNEAVGVSEEVKALVDKMVYLPMSGLTESYNVSVATAIALYEIVRQQEKNG
ncbi:MAG: RNA methyltransferase, partial [Patescibacteria group bacterium]|nr:RNA methyltransferase [Patescibacteria group bacterium]